MPLGTAPLRGAPQRCNAKAAVYPMISNPPHLVVFGNLTLDDIVQPNGPVHARCIGGDALYGVLAARLFDNATEMVAPVGDDFPAPIRARMAAAGLSAEGLPERACPTLHTRFVYHSADRREETLLSDAANFDILSPQAGDVPARYFGAQGFMILAMTLAAQRALVAACRARGRGLIALDPQQAYIAGNEAALLDLVARVDVFMPSLAEVKLLLGHEDELVAARHLAGLGPRIVVIKMGARGSLVYDSAGEDWFVQPACSMEVVDTTGCGDAFCSAFMACLIRGPSSLRVAAAAGAAAASFALSAYGAEGLFSAARVEAQRRLAWCLDLATAP